MQSSNAPKETPDFAATSNRTVLILPFHNDSKAPGLEWIGEAFSEVLGQRMQSPSIFVISREDRLYAFDRVGIPASTQLSRATLLRIAEQMGVDYVVLGNYNYDGNSFSSKAQLLDMRRLHLSPFVVESGSLLQLIDIQAATAWDLMHVIQTELAATKQDFIADTKDIRLDALENYVRGVVATSNTEKIRRLKEAVRLNPNYSVAILALGKTYFDQRDYSSAVVWLAKIPQSDKHAAEANFFLGLAAYYSGNVDRAAEAFKVVADRFPLTEVYNNLGVAEARRNKYGSLDYLKKAVAADPTEPDYHFNLALSLARIGDKQAAVRELKETLSLRPSDTEARNYLQTLTISSASSSRPPLERIKRNYDEASFRQLAFVMENAEEAQMANSDPKKHAAMHVDQGRQRLSQGFYEEARDHFRRALALDPQNSDARLGLANAQIALNDLAGARSELERSLHDRPTPDAYVALAQLHLKENKLDAANQDLAQALRLEPANSSALQLRQQVTSRLDTPPRAKQ
ncbi:MAG TPA: tetratricopeptide repeat protein [Terriglobales bacterium]|jgi:tetratricopeptide (TPR) repeat protein|nr:tetratricopeptide repeat protein [Terriglobales bacterium]